MNLSNGGMKFGRFKDGREKKGNPKTLFRASKRWKDFRAAMIEMNGATCEMCGMRYPAAKHHLLQVHHLHPDDYELLDSALFSVLCSSCHDTVERFVTRINGKAFVPPSNIQQWDALLDAHLSEPARAKWRLILSGNYQTPIKAKVPKGKKNEI